MFPGERAGEQASRIAWRQSEDRSTWVAEAAGLRLAVTRRTDGRWQPAMPGEPGPDFATRLEAQRWCEGKVAP